MTSNLDDGGPDTWPRHYYQALSLYGLSEIAGKTANPTIVEMLHLCKDIPEDLKNSDETAWCSAAMCLIMSRAGLTHTASANARSWLKWGTTVVIPRLGDVCIFSRDDAGPKGGHVALFVRKAGRVFHTIGGNQANKVGEGAYSEDRLLGIRRA